MSDMGARGLPRRNAPPSIDDEPSGLTSVSSSAVSWQRMIGPDFSSFSTVPGAAASHDSSMVLTTLALLITSRPSVPRFRRCVGRKV